MFKCLSYFVFFYFLGSGVISCGSSSGTTNSDAIFDQFSSSSVPNSPKKTDDEESSYSPLKFVDVSAQMGFDQYAHAHRAGSVLTEPMKKSGGLAAGDFDGDGYIDIYLIGGSGRKNYLLYNEQGQGFLDVASLVGVDIDGEMGAGPAFFDLDGDYDLDLFVGAVEGDPIYLLENDGTGFFLDKTASSGLVLQVAHTFSPAFGDVNSDGFLDMFLAHWSVRHDETKGDAQHLWINNGDGSFSSQALESGGVNSLLHERNSGLFADWTLSSIFVDINNDQLSDLLVASDFGTSQVFVNRGDGTFDNSTNTNINDGFGMGGAVADFNDDGFMDWFVTSISLPPESDKSAEVFDGNRLYQNLGDGVFEDISESAGVRAGYWGWAACIEDFDNDGYLDIFHVNGWSAQAFQEFSRDPSLLYMSNGDGTFSEVAASLGIEDDGQGRGVLCFDYDQDGDMDIFISNHSAPPKLFQNEVNNGNNFLSIELIGLSPNTQAVGARVYVEGAGRRQMRELHLGNNFASQNPLLQHFGLGSLLEVEILEIHWPDGSMTVEEKIQANQRLKIKHPDFVD